MVHVEEPRILDDFLVGANRSSKHSTVTNFYHVTDRVYEIDDNC